MTNTSLNKRYDILDGLRGISAIFVMLSHFSQFVGLSWFKNASCAVDLFFIISGFVISNSYGYKISQGMTFKNYCASRLIRLAPLNIFAIFIGLLALILYLINDLNFSSQKILGTILSAIFGFLFIPFPNDFNWPYGNLMQSGGLFPLNLPAWSLTYELIAYLIFFCLVSFSKKLPSVFICLTFFIVLVLFTLIFKNPNPGWNDQTFILGIPRVLGAFFIGVLIYKIQTKIKNKIFTMMFLLSLSVIIIIFGNNFYSLINSLIVIPLLIFTSINISLKPNVSKFFRFLGEMSFPIYILHIPLATLLFYLIPSLKNNHSFLIIIILTASLVSLSSALNYYDKLIRKYLNSIFLA